MFGYKEMSECVSKQYRKCSIVSVHPYAHVRMDLVYTTCINTGTIPVQYTCTYTSTVPDNVPVLNIST